jgi:putative ABC transport system permease protein
MSWLDGARARARLLFARTAAESRTTEEIAFHLDMEAGRLAREHGLEPNEARRRALATFGGVENHKEALRSDRGLAWLAGMSLDLKLGLRMMLKYPGLTFIGVLGLSVAVAIGAAAFGVIHNFVGASLPYDEGDRIVAIQNLNRGSDDRGRPLHLHDLVTWRADLRAIAAFGAYRTVDRNLIITRERPEPVRIAEMTASGFRITRVPPLLGRYFNEDDERKGAPAVVVIGYSIWQTRFRGDSSIIGRTLRLGATQHVVIGVMPEGFAFPVNNGIWTPLRLDAADYEPGKAPAISVFGRLAPNATLHDARTQAETIALRLAAAHPSTHARVRTWVTPYTRVFTEQPQVAWAFYLAQVLVTLLLVVIGTNVAILVYARTASRMGEIALRTALGASRRRIVAQLFAEALVLTTTASAVGLVGAWLALRELGTYVVQVAGDQTPFWWKFGISPGAVLYVIGLAVLSAAIVGVLPAFKATQRRVHVTLQHLGSGGSGIRLGRTWTVLIVAQVAVAVALLPVVVYALVVQAAKNQAPAGPAIPTKDWVAASLRLDSEASGTDDAAALDRAFSTRYAAVVAELIRRLRSEPAVADVVLASAAPGEDRRNKFEMERGRSPLEADSARDTVPATNLAGFGRIEVGFFRAFGVPVLAGRGFLPGDVAPEPNVVIVNQSFVKAFLGGADPLGRRVREAAQGREGDPEAVPAGPWKEIVGVVADFPSKDAEVVPIAPRLYGPLDPQTARDVTIAVRVRGAAPAMLGGRLREVAVAVDPMLRLADVRVLDKAQSFEKVANRYVFIAITLLTVSVILLSSAGIYALMSFTITRRRREIGIRAALGAGPRSVLVGVLRKTAGQIGLGIGIGTVMAGAMIQGMQGGRGDAQGLLVLLGVALFMGAVGVAAALGPARRALRIQPTEALRTD